MSSHLDALTSESLSGVPMRRKVVAPPPSVDHAAQLANVLAQSHEKLAHTLTNALTSRSTTAPTPSPRAMSFDFSRGPDGQIDGGTVSNGEQEWRLVVTRMGGQLSIEATPG